MECTWRACLRSPADSSPDLNAYASLFDDDLGAGFIGANHTHHWRNSLPADRILGLEALTYAGNRASVQLKINEGQIRFVQGSITDRALLARLLAEHKIIRKLL